jgi:hypothetical protein
MYPRQRFRSSHFAPVTAEVATPYAHFFRNSSVPEGRGEKNHGVGRSVRRSRGAAAQLRAGKPTSADGESVAYRSEKPGKSPRRLFSLPEPNLVKKCANTAQTSASIS